MALPKKLKYLNLFNDGNSYLGTVSALTLPKLTRKLENYRGGGMTGSAAIDFGLDDDALTFEWTVGGLDELVNLMLRVQGYWLLLDKRPQEFPVTIEA